MEEEEGCVEQINYFLFKVASAGQSGRRAAKHRRTYDVVVLPGQLYWCGCNDRKHRGLACKHIHAAFARMRREEREDAAEARFAEDAAAESMAAAAAAAAAPGEDGGGGPPKGAAATSAYAAHLCMTDALPPLSHPAGRPGAPGAGGGEAIRVARPGPCERPCCAAPRIIKNGVRRNGHYDNQRYRCKSCGRSFSGNAGFERPKAAPEVVTQAIRMWIAGISLPAVRLWLEEHASITVSHRTILGWAGSRTAMIEEYADKALAPRVSGVWRTNEMYYDIRGDEQYAF